ncbi:DUF4345 family protein [Chloroflexi bacterium TSY]|nr:DUF4345 family protein [Chloroflexi bacterium TSY]
MKIAVRILLGLVSLMFLYNGFLYMFTPEAQLGSTMIEPTGDRIFGMSNVRANIGAPMVTFGIMYAAAAIRMITAPLHVVMVFLVVAIIARIAGIVSLGVDADYFSVRIIAVLTVFLLVAIFGYWTFQRDDA